MLLDANQQMIHFTSHSHVTKMPKDNRYHDYFLAFNTEGNHDMHDESRKT